MSARFDQCEWFASGKWLHSDVGSTIAMCTSPSHAQMVAEDHNALLAERERLCRENAATRARARAVVGVLWASVALAVLIYLSVRWSQ